jgi:hypothetical protein
MSEVDIKEIKNYTEDGKEIKAWIVSNGEFTISVNELTLDDVCKKLKIRTDYKLETKLRKIFEKKKG